MAHDSLSLDALPSLDQLDGFELPEGWSYHAGVLTCDFYLCTPYEAYVLEDNFKNAYCRISNDQVTEFLTFLTESE